MGSHGDEKIYIRLGGIYTLEQIAQNPKEYHWTIIEIFSDFIREKRSIQYQSDWNCDPVNLDGSSVSKVPIDVCAVFTALGRRNVSQDQGKKINLHRVDLAGMILSDTQDFNLSNITFAHSNLSHNHFAKADFTGANFNGCRLKHTNFCGANMSKATLGANFSDALLIETDFSDSVFFGAIFHKASVKDAIFKGADLSNKRFSHGCDFSQAYDVKHAIFDEKTEIEGAIFPGDFQFSKTKS